MNIYLLGLTLNYPRWAGHLGHRGSVTGINLITKLHFIPATQVQSMPMRRTKLLVNTYMACCFSFKTTKFRHLPLNIYRNHCQVCQHYYPRGKLESHLGNQLRSYLKKTNIKSITILLIVVWSNLPRLDIIASIASAFSTMVTSVAIKAFVLVAAALPFAQAQTIQDGNQVVGMNSASCVLSFNQHILTLYSCQ